MDELIFASESGIMEVILSREFYCTMLSQCEKSHPLETGGILIGHYSQDLNSACITRIIDSTKKSTRGPFSFFRSNAGLIDILNDEWRQGYYYLGEWHFHPNASSVPSNIDISQMHKISRYKKLHCPEPILIIIGGSVRGWNISCYVVKNGINPLILEGKAATALHL